MANRAQKLALAIERLKMTLEDIEEDGGLKWCYRCRQWH